MLQLQATTFNSLLLLLILDVGIARIKFIINFQFFIVITP